jgi:hypothetical protein
MLIDVNKTENIILIDVNKTENMGLCNKWVRSFCTNIILIVNKTENIIVTNLTCYCGCGF